jgi:hypothetical protein
LIWQHLHASVCFAVHIPDLPAFAGQRISTALSTCQFQWAEFDWHYEQSQQLSSAATAGV